MRKKTLFQTSVAIRRSLLQETGAEDYCTLFNRLIARLRCMGSVISPKITAHGVCLLLCGARCPAYNGEGLTVTFGGLWIGKLQFEVRKFL